MNVAFYCRVGSTEQNIESQKEKCMGLLSSEDKLTCIYEDVGFSGLDDNRPSLIKLIEEANSGKFQKVVSTEPSIIYRNLGKMIEFKEKMDKQKLFLPLQRVKLCLTILRIILQWAYNRKNEIFLSLRKWVL